MAIDRLPDDWTARVNSAREGLLQVAIANWQQVARIRRDLLADEVGASEAERELARLQATEDDSDGM